MVPGSLSCRQDFGRRHCGGGRKTPAGDLRVGRGTWKQVWKKSWTLLPRTSATGVVGVCPLWNLAARMVFTQSGTSTPGRRLLCSSSLQHRCITKGETQLTPLLVDAKLLSQSQLLWLTTYLPWQRESAPHSPLRFSLYHSHQAPHYHPANTSPSNTPLLEETDEVGWGNHSWGYSQVITLQRTSEIPQEVQFGASAKLSHHYVK